MSLSLIRHSIWRLHHLLNDDWFLCMFEMDGARCACAIQIMDEHRKWYTHFSIRFKQIDISIQKAISAGL